jgi:3-hydroxybutyryl-CoA dehydrogenase
MKITTVGVVGAGQMGAGIAQVCAAAGLSTQLYDAQGSAIDRGLKTIETSLERFVKKEQISAADAKATFNNIQRAEKLEALAQCDLVIEAIIENFDIKQQVFSKLDEYCKKSTILASNTSSISITRIAASTKRPEQVIGAHFMNPVPIMKLVEIIRGLQTSDATYNTLQAFCEQISKTTVLGLDAPGFIVNRILCPMINEAIFLLEQGVKKEDIDAAMKLGTNQPMGPLELADFVGLDTLLYILRILHNELGEDKYRPCPLLIKYVEAGWYGRKNGRGFYTY